VEVLRDEDTGFWIVEASQEELKLKPDYLAALSRYLTTFDRLAQVAKHVDEAQFILALLSVRGIQGAGWDPYATTIDGIKAATQLHNEAEDRLAARHLQLWIYGHIVEASVPYELIGNLAQVAVGEAAVMDPFRNLGTRPSPGRKIAQICEWADQAGNEALSHLLPQIWDAELRNAVFHSDYAIHGDEIRLPGVGQSRSLEEVALLTGKASAYHDGVLGARRFHLESYTEPKRVRGGSITPANSDEELMIIVREGAGAVGLKDTLTAADRAAGGITFHYVARVSQEEIAMLNADPDLALLSARPSSESPEDSGISRPAT
jgi:hypothetical protein